MTIFLDLMRRDSIRVTRYAMIEWHSTMDSGIETSGEHAVCGHRDKTRRSAQRQGRIMD
jgi:hypothetical protein